MLQSEDGISTDHVDDIAVVRFLRISCRTFSQKKSARAHEYLGRADESVEFIPTLPALQVHAADWLQQVLIFG